METSGAKAYSTTNGRSGAKFRMNIFQSYFVLDTTNTVGE